MASCNHIINLALSKLGVSGGSKPARPADLQIGLDTLISLYRELISSGRLGSARPVFPKGAYVARENDRILRGRECTSVTLPYSVHNDRRWGGDCDAYDDDYSYYGYGGFEFHRDARRQPRDGCFIIIADEITGNMVDYIYEAYTASWISVFDLSLQEYQEVLDSNGNVIEIIKPSIAPLSTRDANGLAALLAKRLADYFGQTITQTINDAATEYEATLVLGWGEPEQPSVRKEWF